MYDIEYSNEKASYIISNFFGNVQRNFVRIS